MKNNNAENTAEENVHINHRQRLRNQYINFGIEHMEEHNVLELLLFYSIPRRDTNELAHRLLKRFGSLSGVLSASEVELSSVEGLGENSVMLLRFVSDIHKKYTVFSEDSRDFTDKAQIGEYFTEYFRGFGNERTVALFLDDMLNKIDCITISEGSNSKTEISMTKLVHFSVIHNAPNIILAHNHPHAASIPSEKDIKSTIEIRKFLANIDINLLEHFVVGGKDYTPIFEFLENAMSGKRELMK